MYYKTMNHLYPVASEQNSESCGTSTQLNHGLGENCGLSAKKRKARTIPEPPRKRLRCAGEDAQLAFEAVPAKGCKRKASTERGTPDKKLKCEPSFTNSSEAIRGTNWTEQDNAEKLPASETPRNTKHACDPSPAYSGPSAFTANSGSPFLPLPHDRAHFEMLYLELYKLGEGGFGSVYAGWRMTDSLPVAIKHISKEHVLFEQVVLNGKTHTIPLEVLLMLRAGGAPGSVDTSAAVAIIDWYDLEKEVLLIMERPDPCVNLLIYIENNGGCLEEDVAKNIMKQLVDASLTMHTKDIFHRDIKIENLLVETGSNDLRVRLIDFGCGCWVQEEAYSIFSGTSAYAPPEFFTSGTYEATPTTVWQLGALLYEMLKGVHEFKTTEFVRRRKNYNRGLSKDCQNFLKQCLAGSPKQRATLEQIQLHPWLQDQAEVTS